MESIIHTIFYEQNEHFVFYDQYKENKHGRQEYEYLGRFMRQRVAHWCKDDIQTILAKFGLPGVSKELAETIDNLFDSTIEGYYYLSAASTDGYADEVIKWVLGPIATELNKGRVLSQICPHWVLRIFVRYLVEEKFPRHFAKQIFEILIKENPEFIRYCHGHQEYGCYGDQPEGCENCDMVSPLSCAVIEGYIDRIIADPKFVAIDTSKINDIVLGILKENQEKADEAKSNPKLIQWFVGQVLRSHKGISPGLVKESIEKQLLRSQHS